MTLKTVVSSKTQPDAQNIQALMEAWKTIDLASCPYHYNFHMHTTCSDGQLQPEALMEQALSIGLKGMAITDHHSVRGYYKAQSWLDETRSQQPTAKFPHVWIGVEVTSKLLGTEVHILGYGFDPARPIMEAYLQGSRPLGSDALAENVIAAIHKAGGLAVLAHPARYQRPACELVPVAAKIGIDGAEAYYAYNNPKPWQPSLKETEHVKYLSEVYNLFTTCGTDTHGKNLLQRI